MKSGKIVPRGHKGHAIAQSPEEPRARGQARGPIEHSQRDRAQAVLVNLWVSNEGSTLNPLVERLFEPRRVNHCDLAYATFTRAALSGRSVPKARW